MWKEYFPMKFPNMCWCRNPRWKTVLGWEEPIEVNLCQSTSGLRFPRLTHSSNLATVFFPPVTFNTGSGFHYLFRSPTVLCFTAQTQNHYMHGYSSVGQERRKVSSRGRCKHLKVIMSWIQKETSGSPDLCMIKTRQWTCRVVGWCGIPDWKWWQIQWRTNKLMYNSYGFSSFVILRKTLLYLFHNYIKYYKDKYYETLTLCLISIRVLNSIHVTTFILDIKIKFRGVGELARR